MKYKEPELCNKTVYDCEKCKKLLTQQVNYNAVLIDDHMPHWMQSRLDYTTKYINKNSNREKNSVLVPCLRKCNSNFKNFIEKHINDKFYIIGDYDYHGSNIKKLSNQNDDGMIRLYNMCETVYHEPDTFWAGERIYFEALLKLVILVE